jgi:hypothetical protein
MPDRTVTIRRVKTSDLIASWKVYHDATKRHPLGSVMFGPGRLPTDAVSLRCANLSLSCPDPDRMPVWFRHIVAWFYAKKPLTVSVGPECESFFTAR